MKKNRLIIIAEIGVNHNGSFSKAYSLIKNAKKFGADYVKFQYFLPENLVIKNCPLVDYQKSSKFKNQFEMLKLYQLSLDKLLKLKKMAVNLKVKFMISAFGLDDYLMAKKKLKLTEIKIPSGELENYELLSKLDYKKIKIFLSTGMSNLSIICNSLNVIAKSKIFSVSKGHVKIKNIKIFKQLQKKIVLMHCVSNYPVKNEDSNILALTQLSKFKLNLGYSDHTVNSTSALGSYMLGARVFEKHFTSNKKLKGPDHLSSSDYKDFKLYTEQLRDLEKMLKVRGKNIRKNEKKISILVKKSLVAKKSINKKEKFSYENLTTKRPGYGISSSKFLHYLGRKAKKKYLPDQFI